MSEDIDLDNCTHVDDYGSLFMDGFCMVCGDPDVSDPVIRKICNIPDPAHTHTKDDPRVFVFGSNAAGIHGAGAAAYARLELGAVLGVGEGPTGRTYALPTCYRPGEPVTMPELAVYVYNFLEYARQHPDTRFFVSPVGCGIAGFTEEEVSYIFRELGIPDNCDMPPGWR